MPYVTYPMSPDGLVVDVVIGLRRSRVQALRAAGQPIPNSVRLRGLIDTGADVTSISDPAVAPLGLIPVGSMAVNTASGLALVNRYAVSLSLLTPASAGSQGLVRPNLNVLGMVAAPFGFDVLIGLDVLADCLLLVDGRGGSFTLAF